MCHAMLANVYSALDEDKKAKFHEEKYYFFKDSISGLKKIKKIGALEQKHLSQTQKDSLNSTQQNNPSLNQNNELSSQTKIVIGLSILILFLSFSYLYLKKKRKEKVSLPESDSLVEAKIDEYFKTLFARLDQNETVPAVDKNSSSNDVNLKPINDMTEFLKTNLTTPNTWASFEHYFEKVHKNFFKDLKTMYPTISINELNMCALLKLNLRNKDIAQIMGISYDSVRKAQSRLSQKLEISTDKNLRDFILKT